MIFVVFGKILYEKSNYLGFKLKVNRLILEQNIINNLNIFMRSNFSFLNVDRIRINMPIGMSITPKNIFDVILKMGFSCMF